MTNLMERIVPSESWGLGSADFSSVAFKGGWGPEPPSGAYLVRQSGIIDVGSSKAVAVSIVAFPSSGSFGAGTQMLNETAHWLRRELRLVSRSGVSCSSVSSANVHPRYVQQFRRPTIAHGQE